jgi:endonuclease/exonuclease/phosphatase (EEP) superfamily protein YafD
MFVSFASCAVLCVFIKNESNGDFVSPKENNGSKLYINHINLSSVSNFDALVKELIKSKTDVISFQEVTPEWSQQLDESLSSYFKHKYKAVRIDPFGKALYSRYPITIYDTLNKDLSFDIAATIMKNDKSYRLISSYLTPALDNNSLKIARLQMKNISSHINENNSNVIVLGDFNMVYWAQEISQFRESCDLSNGRKDVIPISLKIPYDQVFYTKDLQCVNVRDIFVANERVGLSTVMQDEILTTPSIKSGFF